MPVSEFVDDRSGEPEEIQANKIPKTNKKETTIERGNPCDDFDIPEWLQEFRENLVDDEIPLQGGSHASSSHEDSLAPELASTVFILISRKTQIESSARTPKLQWLCAKDALVEPYLVPKML